MDVRNLLSLSGVMLVLGAAGYYWGLGSSGKPLLGNDNLQLPDYEARDVESWQTAADGQLLRHLHATAVTHYRNPEQAVISQPVMVLYRDGQATWQVSSLRGIATDHNREVRLENTVHAERVDPGTVPVQLDTDVLNIHTVSQSLDTASKVSVHTAQGRLDSLGLDATLQSETLNLHSEVQGTYVTHP
jgi:LPS export ABC transporter protein LptC